MKKEQNNFERMSFEILHRRYLMKNDKGQVIETEGQMYCRVTDTIAKIESKYSATQKEIKTIAKKFYQLMKSDKFLPNSPTLMNAGRKNGMLSACFVLPIEDSIDGIFTTVKNTALIQKVGGGTGFDFSSLRPTGDIVVSSGGRTSGPISFLRVLAETTNAIQQGAFRRGANMGMMNIHHPDIIKFICAKQNPAAFQNFNISVKLTNAFMARLHENPEAVHIVVNPRTDKKYAIPRSINIASYSIDDLLAESQANSDCYTTKEVWDVIIRNAHATGEPGICFIDRINADNPTPNIGRIDATNPCGEQPLLPFESCNLGSINVAKFVNKEGTDLNWRALKETTALAVRFLDNVIDANHHPIPEVEKATLGSRKIGLGLMGFAHALILLGIRYGSDESVELAGKLAAFIQKHAHQASNELAKERGCFQNWKGSVWDVKHHRSMRNATCTTIAPTGSISRIAGTSGGIEPIYSITTKSLILDGQEFIQLDPLVEWLGTEQGWLTDNIRDFLVQGKPPKDIPEIPQKLAEVLVTAHEVRPEEHVRIQAAFQKYTDNAVSKTVNLPSNATIEEVDKIFRLAHQLGCKGITVYRDGCRKNQVITTAHENTILSSKEIKPRPRNRKTKGETTKYTMGCGKLYVTVNKDEQGLCEVFASLGKGGGCAAQSEATCRIVSAAIRCGIDVRTIVEHLKGIRCLSTMTRRNSNKDIDVLSCPDAIGRAIEESMGERLKSATVSDTNKCPDCGQPLRYESGCDVCSCGYSSCG